VKRRKKLKKVRRSKHKAGLAIIIDNDEGANAACQEQLLTQMSFK